MSLSPLAQGFADKPHRGPGDVALYRAEVDRIAAGESYYVVASEELRQRGYPTRSAFNWRTPLPMWLIGNLPHPVWGKVLLGGLAVVALLMSFPFLVREGGLGVSLVGMLLLIGALLPCWLGELYVMPMLWAGALLTISVAALGSGRTKLGVASGIAALFMRDLAGPYCVFQGAYALWQRRWREAALWTAGLAAYAVYFAWHVWNVMALQTPDATAHEDGWVRFGGLAFLVSLAQMNGFLLTLPQWVSAIYLPLAMLGLASWSSDTGRRTALVTLLFLVLFAVVGQPINQYWGSLIAPLLCLGAARSPWALRDLWLAARATQSRGSATVKMVGESSGGQIAS
ncbi:MAG: hypothetical protein DWQ37_05940 [Planctomycetota bacterium]|nr:MAG: hypothetical protein DWQ37_05940 [Planctomycetota bacterium]